jgi:hypothetical protein
MAHGHNRLSDAPKLEAQIIVIHSTIKTVKSTSESDFI